MKLKSINKVASGGHLNYYHLLYENRLGKDKVYEMISRDKGIQNGSDLNSREPQAVVLVVFNKDYSKLLLNLEFRMAVNEMVYNMPAGLIEQGENVEDAARRELKEETGLDLVTVVDILNPAYSSVGISNEKTVCVICTAEGELGGNPEPDEEIECNWYSKEDIIRLINDKSVKMAARTQMLCYLWAMPFNGR